MVIVRRGNKWPGWKTGVRGRFLADSAFRCLCQWARATSHNGLSLEALTVPTSLGAESCRASEM